MIDETCPVCAESGRVSLGVIREQDAQDNTILGVSASRAEMMLKRLPHITRRYECGQMHRWTRIFYHAWITWDLETGDRFGRIKACEQALTTEMSWPPGSDTRPHGMPSLFPVNPQPPLSDDFTAESLAE